MKKTPTSGLARIFLAAAFLLFGIQIISCGNSSQESSPAVSASASRSKSKSRPVPIRSSDTSGLVLRPKMFVTCANHDCGMPIFTGDSTLRSGNTSTIIFHGTTTTAIPANTTIRIEVSFELADSTQNN